MVSHQSSNNDSQENESTEALKDLKKYLKSANIQDDENWRLRALLNRLGLTKYESEAYIGLVQGGKMTVKKLVQNTGIPQSRSYDTLGSLVKYGMVEQTPVEDNKNGRKEKQFRAVEPEIAVQNLFSYFSFAKDEAIAELQKIKSKKNKSSHIWEIQSKKNIIQTARNLIRRADYEIFLITGYEMLKELSKDIFKAKDRNINVLCIFQEPENFTNDLNLYWNEFLRIKSLQGFPMPYLIIDHHEALVWSRNLFDEAFDDDFSIAQLIEGTEWVSTLSDHFFLSHWNMGVPLPDQRHVEKPTLPKTFVHIHTALAEAQILKDKNIQVYAEVYAKTKDGKKKILTGEIIKLRKDWKQGISTITFKPDDENLGEEVSIGGKYAVLEDFQMDKIIIDDTPFS